MSEDDRFGNTCGTRGVTGIVRMGSIVESGLRAELTGPPAVPTGPPQQSLRIRSEDTACSANRRHWELPTRAVLGYQELQSQEAGAALVIIAFCNSGDRKD